MYVKRFRLSLNKFGREILDRPCLLGLTLFFARAPQILNRGLIALGTSLANTPAN